MPPPETLMDSTEEVLPITLGGRFGGRFGGRRPLQLMHPCLTRLIIISTTQGYLGVLLPVWLTTAVNVWPTYRAKTVRDYMYTMMLHWYPTFDTIFQRDYLHLDGLIIFPVYKISLYAAGSQRHGRHDSKIGIVTFTQLRKGLCYYIPWLVMGCMRPHFQPPEVKCCRDPRSEKPCIMPLCIHGRQSIHISSIHIHTQSIE